MNTRHSFLPRLALWWVFTILLLAVPPSHGQAPLVILPTPIPKPTPKPAAPAVGLSVDAPAISRGAGQVATVTFTRTGDTSAILKILYSVRGTAIGGQDYAGLKSVRKIQVGKSTGTVKITPLPSGGDGTVVIVIEPATDYTVDPAAKKVKVYITD